MDRCQVPNLQLQDIRSAIQKFLASNVISIKDLRSFAGSCNHVASVVFV